MRAIIVEEPISSQSVMINRLRDAGFEVTQATVSRDLKAIGASRRDDRYLISSLNTGDETLEALARAIDEFAESIMRSGRMAVIRTPPGAAQIVAAAIDAAHLEGVLGTIAGDDTLLLITDADATAREAVKYLEEIGGRT